MARQKVHGLRAELSRGLYFDVLLPLPLSRSDRKDIAKTLREMADELDERDWKPAPLDAEGILEVISDLTCEPADDDDD
jgi:hypothetical protein